MSGFLLQRNGLDESIYVDIDLNTFMPNSFAFNFVGRIFVFDFKLFILFTNQLIQYV